MQFIGILFALGYAVILTAIFSVIFRSTGPWNGFWVFLLLIFLTALAVGEWTAPVGPSAWGYYWLPGLFAAIIFALAIAAVTASVPPPPGIINRETSEPENVSESTSKAISIFLWLLLVALVLIAAGGIAWRIFRTVPAPEIGI